MGEEEKVQKKGKGRKEGNDSKKRENILILFPCLILYMPARQKKNSVLP